LPVESLRPWYGERRCSGDSTTQCYARARERKAGTEAERGSPRERSSSVSSAVLRRAIAAGSSLTTSNQREDKLREVGAKAWRRWSKLRWPGVAETAMPTMAHGGASAAACASGGGSEVEGRVRNGRVGRSVARLRLRQAGPVGTRRAHRRMAATRRARSCAGRDAARVGEWARHGAGRVGSASWAKSEAAAQQGKNEILFSNYFQFLLHSNEFLN